MAMNRRDLFKWVGGAAVVAAAPAIIKAEEPIWDDAVPQKPYKPLSYSRLPLIANEKGEFEFYDINTDKMITYRRDGETEYIALQKSIVA